MHQWRDLGEFFYFKEKNKTESERRSTFNGLQTIRKERNEKKKKKKEACMIRCLVFFIKYFLKRFGTDTCS